MLKENQELQKLMDWITSHEHAWDMICGPGIDSFSVKECMDISQELVDRGLYSVAAVLLEKLMRDKAIHEIVGKRISARLCGVTNNKGFLSECVLAIYEEVDDINRILSF